jgi:hypothetical protein
MHNGICRRLLVLSALSVLFFACSDDPTEENALITPHLPFAEMIVRDTTIVADSSSTFKEITAMNGTVNLVGKSGNYTSTMLLAFYTSYFPDRDTVNVLRATLYLRGTSFYGDSTGRVSFTIHRASTSWNQSTFTLDSLQSGLYESRVRGSYSSGVKSDTALVEIPLDTAMAREWLASTTSSEYTLRYGMVFVPTAEATAIQGFASFESDSTAWVPAVKLVCQNVAGTVIDSATYSLGVDTFVGEVDNLVADPTLMYAQAGITYRSIVHFNVGFLPKGAIVNSAQLTLQANPAASKLNRFCQDTSLAVHIMTASSSTSSFSSSGSGAFLVPGSQTLYGADVASIVQSWHKGSNYGALIRIYGTREFSSLDLVTLYNQTAEEARRPRLKIIYSVPKY